MEMQCCHLSNIVDPLATFFPSKSAQTLFSFWELPVAYCRARSCSPSARTPLSLSLSASALVSARQRGPALSVKHRYYVASLILHASIAEITAQLLSLSYVYLISSDDGSIIRIFVQINILISSYSFRCLTTETEKKIAMKTVFIENLAASKYSMWAQRQTHAIINNIGYVHFACSEEVSCPAQKNI